MQIKTLGEMRRPIFVKLIFIFVLTAVLVVGLVVGMATHFSRLHDSVWTVRNSNRLEYAYLLVEKIGFPPDLQKADAIVARTGMRMRIEGPGVNYANPKFTKLISAVEQRAHRCSWSADAKIMTSEGRVFLVISRQGYDYLFSYQNDSFLDERPEWWPILSALVLLALFLNYLAIRWLFQPLSWLSEGVRKVQRGELNFEIPTRDHDELGDLTKSFNQMTREIESVLSSKEQLLLDVSHELRSPLTRIKVALELNDEAYQEQIKKNIRDLEVMISELLESARLDTPQGNLVLETVRLSDLLDRVSRKMNLEHPGILVERVSETIMLQIDPTRIETVLRNLFENALKYSRHQNEPVRVSVTESGAQEIWIQVQDHGPGIAEEEKQLIFEPFYRIDKSRVRETGGYGLGLALCKKIMLAHRGNVEVTQSDSKGTTFTLKFKR